MAEQRYPTGARFAPDARDANYPMRAMHQQLGMAEKKPPRTKSWRTWTVLDQGQTPACVGYSCEGLLLASPYRQRYLDGYGIYQAAQLVDEWPGEDPNAGTSVRAGLKVLQDAGYIESYHWASGWDDIKRQIAFVGPAVLGITWFNSMFGPDQFGHLAVDPGSGDAGGHAILAVGYDGDWLRLHNSWGRGFGLKGDCWLRRVDFERLLSDYHAEIVAVIERQP